MYGTKGQFSSQVLQSWLVYSYFVYFFCIYSVISLNDLSAGFINKKITKLTKTTIFLEKNKHIYCLEIT